MQQGRNRTASLQILSPTAFGRQVLGIARTIARMRGSLETISVAELSMQLGGQGVSGTLSLESEGHTGQVVFQDGAVVWATSPSRGARIGDRLVHAGLLDPYYVDQAAQAQRDAPPGTGIAALLVDRGLISADAARVFLQEQLIDALTDLLGWRTGSFDLSSDPPPVIRLAVAVPTESLLTEVRRRLAEQQRVRSVVTSLTLVPTATAHTPQHLALDESVVLRQVDGTSTVGDLAARLGFGDNEARRIVYGLTLLDAISLDGAAATPVDDPLDEVEHAIEDSLDEALAGHVSEGAGDELESILEGLLASPADEAEVAAESDDLPAAEVEAAPPAEQLDEPVAAAAPEVGAPSRIEAGRFDTDDVDEPRPWVGYAKALPGTSPRERASTPPPAPMTGDLPYVASAEPPAAAVGREPPGRTTAPDPFARSEAASWLADVNDPEAPDEQVTAPTADAPPASDEPIWDVGQTAPAPSDDIASPDVAAPEAPPEEPTAPEAPAAPDVDDAPPPSFSSRRSGGDDLSALLAELSSLSTDDDPGDRTPAPPPRKPSRPSADDDAKDPRKRRRFGR